MTPDTVRSTGVPAVLLLTDAGRRARIMAQCGIPFERAYVMIFGRRPRLLKADRRAAALRLSNLKRSIWERPSC